MRQQFPFYKSFDDVAEDLTDIQLASYIRTLLDVQFLRIKIDDVSFKDKSLNLVWKSQKYSIKKSVFGYLDGQKRKDLKDPFLGAYSETQLPCEGVHKPTIPPKEELEWQCKVKEEVKEEVKFTFTLKSQKLLSSTSKEYLQNLEEYILNAGKPMSYQDFYNQCEMKPYKYKNFKMAYDSWNKKSTVSNPQPKSFQQMNRDSFDEGFKKVSQCNIYDIIDEIDAQTNEIQGVICE